MYSPTHFKNATTRSQNSYLPFRRQVTSFYFKPYCISPSVPMAPLWAFSSFSIISPFWLLFGQRTVKLNAFFHLDDDGQVETIDEQVLFDQINNTFAQFSYKKTLLGTVDASRGLPAGDRNFVFSLKKDIDQYLEIFANLDPIYSEQHLNQVLLYYWELNEYLHSQPELELYIDHSWVIPLLTQFNWGRVHLPFLSSTLIKMEKKKVMHLLARNIYTAHATLHLKNVSLKGLRQFLSFVVLQKHRDCAQISPEVFLGELKKGLTSLHLRLERDNLLKKLVRKKSLLVLTQYLLDDFTSTPSTSNSISPCPSGGKKTNANPLMQFLTQQSVKNALAGGGLLFASVFGTSIGLRLMAEKNTYYSAPFAIMIEQNPYSSAPFATIPRVKFGSQGTSSQQKTLAAPAKLQRAERRAKVPTALLATFDIIQPNHAHLVIHKTQKRVLMVLPGVDLSPPPLYNINTDIKQEVFNEKMNKALRAHSINPNEAQFTYEVVDGDEGEELFPGASKKPVSAVVGNFNYSQAATVKQWLLENLEPYGIKEMDKGLQAAHSFSLGLAAVTKDDLNESKVVQARPSKQFDPSLSVLAPKAWNEITDSVGAMQFDYTTPSLKAFFEKRINFVNTALNQAASSVLGCSSLGYDNHTVVVYLKNRLISEFRIQTEAEYTKLVKHFRAIYKLEDDALLSDFAMLHMGIRRGLLALDNKRASIIENCMSQETLIGQFQSQNNRGVTANQVRSHLLAVKNHTTALQSFLSNYKNGIEKVSRLYLCQVRLGSLLNDDYISARLNSTDIAVSNQLEGFYNELHHKINSACQLAPSIEPALSSWAKKVDLSSLQPELTIINKEILNSLLNIKSEFQHEGRKPFYLFRSKDSGLKEISLQDIRPASQIVVASGFSEFKSPTTMAALSAAFEENGSDPSESRQKPLTSEDNTIIKSYPAVRMFQGGSQGAPAPNWAITPRTTTPNIPPVAADSQGIERALQSAGLQDFTDGASTSAGANKVVLRRKQ